VFVLGLHGQLFLALVLLAALLAAAVLAYRAEPARSIGD
jgi:hypothetical protein